MVDVVDVFFFIHRCVTGRLRNTFFRSHGSSGMVSMGSHTSQSSGDKNHCCSPFSLLRLSSRQCSSAVVKQLNGGGLRNKRVGTMSLTVCLPIQQVSVLLSYTVERKVRFIRRRENMVAIQLSCGS